MLHSGTGKPRLPRFFFPGEKLSWPQALEVLALWGLLYLALLVVLAALVPIPPPFGFHLPGLAAVLIASSVVLLIRPWLRRRPRTAGAVRGAAVAAALVVGAHFLLLSSDHVMTTWSGRSLPLGVLVLLCLASVHEELLFRGVGFEALAAVSPALALAISSLVFALLHGSNPAVSSLALVNIGLGGVFLGLLRLRWGLLAAVGAHIVWNLTTGAILGYPVSGWRAGEGVFRSEPLQTGWWWSGGNFGIEGGLALTLLLICTILPLLHGGLLRSSDVFETDGSSEPVTSVEMENK